MLIYRSPKGVPFETESDLRDKGSSRTPDILLKCPVGVEFGDEWRVVSWIDSKVWDYLLSLRCLVAEWNCNQFYYSCGCLMHSLFYSHNSISIISPHTKALFGDEGTHLTSVLPQAESYVHRFGPGMILYWFGHAPLSKLGDANGDLVIQGYDLPQKFLWPTGEYCYRDPIALPKTPASQSQPDHQLPESPTYRSEVIS